MINYIEKLQEERAQRIENIKQEEAQVISQITLPYLVLYIKVNIDDLLEDFNMGFITPIELMNQIIDNNIKEVKQGTTFQEMLQVLDEEVIRDMFPNPNYVLNVENVKTFVHKLIDRLAV